MLEDLVLQWGALAGFAALIAFVINVLKHFGLVADGSAVTWSAALNLIGLAALLGLRVYAPQVDIAAVDARVAEAVQVALVIFGYVIQLLAAKGAHLAVRGVPLVGASYSERRSD